MYSGRRDCLLSVGAGAGEVFAVLAPAAGRFLNHLLYRCIRYSTESSFSPFSSAHFSFSWPRSVLRNTKFRQFSAACRTVYLVSIQYVDTTAIFTIMDIHHDESLLFFFLSISFCHILPYPATKRVRQKAR